MARSRELVHGFCRCIDVVGYNLLYPVRVRSSGLGLSYRRWPDKLVIWLISGLYNLLAYLLTYLLTYSMEHSPSWEAVAQLIKKFPAFYGTQQFITAFTSARHLSLSWARSVQSVTPPPTSWMSILILLFHLRLGLPRVLFHSGFPTKTLYKLLPSPSTPFKYRNTELPWRQRQWILTKLRLYLTASLPMCVAQSAFAFLYIISFHGWLS